MRPFASESLFNSPFLPALAFHCYLPSNISSVTFIFLPSWLNSWLAPSTPFELGWLVTQTQISTDSKPLRCMKRGNRHLYPHLIYWPWCKEAVNQLGNTIIKYPTGRLSICSEPQVHAVSEYIFLLCYGKWPHKTVGNFNSS